MKASPTARTMAQLRLEGWIAEKVEQRLPIPGRFVTRDMGGFGDILAWKPGEGILAVQATSASNVPAHAVKAAGLKTLRPWLEAGGRFEIWGWAKYGARGERKLWGRRRVVYQLECGALLTHDLSAETAA